MTSPEISICIVNFNAKEYLRACLYSIETKTTRTSYELIVVDNHSQDGSAEMLREEFPEVTLIENDANEGFSRPMNKALKRARGRCYLLLNPDTLFENDVPGLLSAYLDSHPDVGIVGPKVLNPDGTLQAPCKRSEARPRDVFMYFSGLAKRFPKDPRFSGYTLAYLDEDETHNVDGVSGSCMLVRRTLAEQIGYLDERFFAYQEDADYCIRARKAGWKVVYYPDAKIIHFGGKGGSKVKPVQSIIAWHYSYYQYYKKHFAPDYFFLFNGLFYSLMGMKLGWALVKNMLLGVPFGGSRKPG